MRSNPEIFYMYACENNFANHWLNLLNESRPSTLNGRSTKRNDLKSNGMKGRNVIVITNFNFIHPQLQDKRNISFGHEI